jgi:hypothetical protein
MVMAIIVTPAATAGCNRTKLRVTQKASGMVANIKKMIASTDSRLI